MQQEGSSSNQAGGCLARLFWMVAGNLAIVLFAVGIGQTRAGFSLVLQDALFWGTVLGVLVVRYVDIRYFGGETVDNQPATMADWRRYALTIVIASLVLWLGAHCFGPLF